jgi:fatty acid synthase subunit alpha, fungi type
MISAVAIAASSTLASYTINVSKAVKWLFYMGLRGQDSFPVLALEPKIVQDAVEEDEGTPSPMLAVLGLTLKALKVHIDNTNSHLPANSKLFVSLNNGAKNFVVTGPSRALYGFVTALCKIRAPAGLDQSKIPFSQRKIVFSMRFLVVNVPDHSDYLVGATEKAFNIDLAGEELWEASELQIPVFHTEDGTFF